PFGAGTHTLKGGSFLCADNFCRRYRPAARHPQETDFSSNHIGFRIVRDLPSET
ncbi:MAG: SUMF1/EgtB/PvdO family nonheme iron enzyme, partial [Pseudomonadota bacterium]